MSSNLQSYSLDEVAKHRSRSDIWFVIHDKVYSVGKFLDGHPGGEEVLVDHAGSDATSAFEDIGHSDEAREMMEEYKVGHYKGNGKATTPTNEIKIQVHDSHSILPYLVPLMAVLAYFAYKWM